MSVVNLLRRQIQRLPKGARAILLTCIFGLGAGLLTVGFQLSINLVFRLGLQSFAQTQSLRDFALSSLGMIVGTSLVAGWLMRRFCPQAAGSGIPQLKLAFWKDFGAVPFRVVWVKFLAGVLTIGGGASLGREGPSVQLAGALGSNLAGLLGEAKQRRRESAAAGAATGLAAAFNTPLAAVTFVMEEIIGDLNSRFLGSILLASVLGALVVHGLVGEQPAFTLLGAQSASGAYTMKPPSLEAYALTPLVALVASLVGVQFQRSSLRLRERSRRTVLGRSWTFPAVGALITWVLGMAVFIATRSGGGEGRLGVFGLGYDDLSAALTLDHGHLQMVWKTALLLLLAKFVATVACYGTGGCGGIFSPTLFFGAMTGVLIVGLLGEFGLKVTGSDVLTLVVVGMSACLGAVVWAPVTGILIVFEMTHEFALVPALMIGALVSQWISRRLNARNFYEALLEQDGHDVEHVRPPRDLTEWQQLPVSAIANFKPVLVGDLARGALEPLLQAHPYDRFPVVLDRQLKGILSREEADRAHRESREPHLETASTCLPKDSIRKLQRLLIDSPSGVVVLTDRPGGKVIGIVTLHDLLRAQTQVAAAQDD